MTIGYSLDKGITLCYTKAKRGNTMKNVVVSVKMPAILKERIDTLARKGDTNRNHWIVRTLTRVSKSRK